MHEQQGSLESTNGNDTMNAHTNERRTDSRSSPTPQGNHRNRPRTYEQPALDDIPLNPKRSGYVLQLVLKQHNWRHSSKDKGVSNKANLVFLPVEEQIKSGTYLLFDDACGTGGMLTVAEETLTAIGKVWQDVYRPTTPAGEVHLKITVVEDVLVVSFKEL